MLSPHLEHSPSCLSVSVTSLVLSRVSFPWSAQPLFFPSQQLHPCVDVIVLLTAFPLDCKLFDGRTASLLFPLSPQGLGQSRRSGYLLSDKEMRTTDLLPPSSLCGGCQAPRCGDGRNRSGSNGWGGGPSRFQPMRVCRTDVCTVPIVLQFKE